MRFWAVVFFLFTIWLALYKTEDPVSTDDPDMDVRKVYSVMWSIIRLKNIQSLLIVLLVCKIGFQVNESVTSLKLLEKGLSREDLAVAVLIDFPAQMIIGWLAAKWSRPATAGKHPLTSGAGTAAAAGSVLRPWIYGFWARLAMAAFSAVVVSAYPTGSRHVSMGYFSAVIATTLLSSLAR
jgi:PAT family acetyl-CoA transporter-like MFS transporter 1